MTDNVSLANCLVEYDPTSIVAGGSSYITIPRITEIGAIGDTAESKEKTVLSDTRKQYGAGLQDSPDKALKGQIIPYQSTGDTHKDDYDLQQTFFGHCRSQQAMMIKITWEDGETNEFLFKPLGYETDAPSQAEWRMFTVNGKQNSNVTPVIPTA